MDDLIKWGASILTTQGVDFGIGLVITAIGFYYNQMILTGDSRERLALALDGRTPIVRYRALLSGALDWVDQLLARDDEKGNPDARPGAFSARLFEFSLTLALLYPAVLMLALWAVRSGSARFGVDFVMLEDSASDVSRVAALVALIVTLLLALIARGKRQTAGNEMKEFWWLMIAVLIVTTGTFALIEANRGAADGSGHEGALLSTAVITSIAAAVVVAAAGAFRGATAFAVALLVAAAAVLVWDAAACGPGSAGIWDRYSCRAPASDADRLSLLFDGISARLGVDRAAVLELGLLPVFAVGAFLSIVFIIALSLPSETRGRPVWAKGAMLRSFAFLFGSAAGAAIGVTLYGGAVSPGTVLGYGLAMFAVVLAAQMASGLVRGMSDWAKAPVLSVLLFGGYMVAAAYGFVWLAEQEAVDKNLKMFFLMFAFLPALNVVFDFLTTGATRYALRRGIATPGGFPYFWTLVDFLIAVVLFALLGMAMVAAAQFIRLADVSSAIGSSSASASPDEAVLAASATQARLVDATQVLADVRQNPGSYSWLFVTMFSTLAPTIAHLAIAIFSIVLFFWSGVSGWVARLVRSGGNDGAARAIAVIALTGFTIVSIIAPIALIALLMFYIGPQAGAIGDAYLTMLEKFAAAISIYRT